MDGITYINEETYHAFYVECLSDELKKAIKKHLSDICFGHIKAERAELKPNIYGYKKAIKDFLSRLEEKREGTKKGMIGELLTHILIREYLPEFKVNTPFFNMEENSIKKGFDLVLLNTNDNELWITEVKFGEKDTNNQTSDKKIENLLKKAKNDLNERLNKSEDMLWQNAINGCSISMKNNDDLKNVVIELLENYQEETATSLNKNIITSGVLFNSTDEKFSINSLKKVHDAWENELFFKKIIILAIQESTYQEVITFFKMEVSS